MAGIFLSYRRADSQGWAGRIFDYMIECFGKQQVFMDIEAGILRGADQK
jgi:hypothetical protein